MTTASGGAAAQSHGAANVATPGDANWQETAANPNHAATVPSNQPVTATPHKPVTATPNQAAKATPANALYRSGTANPDSILSYAYDEDLTVHNGEGFLDASSDLDQIKNLDEFTINLNVCTSVTGIQSLFYVGSNQPGTQNKYFNLYISGDKVGLEIRDGSANPSISASASVADGAYHALAMSFKRNEYYRIYVDGVLTLEDTNPADTARFLDSLGLGGGPDTMTFGKGTRTSGNNYPFTGTINDIDLFDSALPEEEIQRMQGVVDAIEEGTVISQQELPVFTGANPVDLSDQLSDISDLEQGSINVRYRVSDFNNTSNGNMAVFSVSSQTENGTYGIFFINPKTNQMGIYMTADGMEFLNVTANMPEGVTIKDREWHTASFVVNKKQGKYLLYMDGQLCGSGSDRGFFSRLTGADTVLAGGLCTKGDKHSWDFKGNMDLLEVYANPLSAENVAVLHAMTRRVVAAPLPDTAVKSDPVNLFYSGYDGSVAYRIPSLLTTQDGVTIAAIDKRNGGSADNGNIDTAIRRSTDSGDTWGEAQVVLNMPSVTNQDSAFSIDSSMLEDKDTGTVHLLVDMFPESYGLGSSNLLKTGTGYREIDGKNYLELFNPNVNNPQTDQVYIVKEDGYVYEAGTDQLLTKTDYYIPDVSNGSLFKGAERTPAGNIYLYTGSNAGDLTVLRTTYLWMLSSDDDGLTWSKPVDLTPMVKEDWMLFMGTGPGRGIQIEHGPHAGRLVFPVYFSNRNVGGSQASAVIYSDDHGITWHRGESPVELRGVDDLEHMNDGSLILTESQVTEVGNEGRLKIFMRNTGGHVYTATSDDGGATWMNLKEDGALYDSYCQMSVIKYQDQLMYDGVMQDAYVFSNPAASGRNNGTVRIGFYDETRDEFIWPYQQLIQAGKYQYSCLANLSDKQIGLLYEGDAPNIRFTKFSADWVTAPRSTVVGAPSITGITMSQDGKKLTFTVDFDMDMLKVGMPVLKLTVDGKDAAADYVSGTSGSQYVFSYDLKDDKLHHITAVNVSGGDGSSIGNIRNQLPENVEYAFTVGTDQPETPNQPAPAPSSHRGSSGSDSSSEIITKIPASTGSARDWVQDEKGWRMSDERNGFIRNQWKQVNQIWYYLGTDGYMKTGWQQLDRTWYYLDASGAMKTGWQQLGGTWYYLDASGAMKTGWIQLNGEWYYLNRDGSMAANTVIDGYALDENGAMRK